MRFAAFTGLLVADNPALGPIDALHVAYRRAHIVPRGARVRVGREVLELAGVGQLEDAEADQSEEVNA